MVQVSNPECLGWLSILAALSAQGWTVGWAIKGFCPGPCPGSCSLSSLMSLVAAAHFLVLGAGLQVSLFGWSCIRTT